MALTTPLDIVNAACARIGNDPLQDMEEETVGGQTAALLYEDTVDFNLSLSPFSSWACEIRQLSEVTGAVPLSGWTRVFDIPGTYFGPPIWLSDDITHPDRRFTRYTLVNGQVHSDAATLHAFVKFRPDPHRWEPAFRSATITALAAKLALGLASDRNLHAELHGEAYGAPSENHRGGKMRNAINADSYATPPRIADWRNNPLGRGRSGGW